MSSKQKVPVWLYRADIYAQLGVKSRWRARYRAYVEMGVDEEIKQYYGKGKLAPYLGSEAFRDWAYKQRVTDDEAVSTQSRYSFKPSIEEVVERVAQGFSVTPDSIFRPIRGGTNNVPRWVAMYLCQEIGDSRLATIAKRFGLKRTGSIPTTLKKLKHLMESDQWLCRKVKELMG